MDRNAILRAARIAYGGNSRTVGGGTTRVARTTCGGKCRTVNGGTTRADRIAWKWNGRTVDESIIDDPIRRVTAPPLRSPGLPTLGTAERWTGVLQRSPGLLVVGMV